MAIPNDDNASFKDQRDILKEINSELGKQINHVKDASSLYSKLTNIATKLQNDEENITKLNEKQLRNLKERVQANLRDLKTAAEKLTAANATTQAEIALLNAKQDEFKVETQLLDSIKKRIKEEEKINAKLGVTGALLKGISKIPILGDLIDTNEALDKAREKIKAGGGAFAAMGTALKSVGKDILISLKDPLVLITGIVTLFTKFIKLGFEADKQIVDLSKSMSVSREEATLVRDRYIEIQNSSLNLLETTKNLVQAQLELAEAFGATRGFSEQQVRDQVLLTKQMGFQAEEAAGIQQLAMSNGMTAREVTGSVIKQTAALAKQTGIQLDNKKIIGEVAKVSGQLRLQYQNNPELIAKAVVQTQRLGISLDQAKKSAESLLDFESSITNELSAELITGKNLNLERARLLALNGQSAEAAAEMLKQVGSADEFSKMNVIQQEAIAKAVGMTADELANSLVQQQNLTNLGESTKQQIQERVELLRQQGQVDEANRLMNSLGNEQEAQAALERISTQEKFTAAMDKLKSIVASIVEGPAAKFLNMLSNVLQDSNKLKTIFYGIATIIGGISLVKLISGLMTSVVQAGILAAETAATASAITLGIGAIAVIGGIAAIMSAISSAKSEAATPIKDGIIDSKGGLMVSGPKGMYSLDPNDSVIAGTNLGKTSGKNQNTPSVNIDITPIVTELANVKTVLNKILDKDSDMYIDSTKMGTGANIGTYKVQ